MYTSYSLENAHSVDQAIELINEGSDKLSSEQLAGQHAWACAKESGYGVSSDSLDGQLEIIAEQGAKFDHGAALEHALKLAENDSE